MTAALRRDLIGVFTLALAGLMGCFWVPETLVPTLNTFLVYVALTTSMDLLLGTTGLFGLGHAAFFGSAAYASVLLNHDAGFSLPAAAVVSLVLVAVLATCIGYPATGRTSGLYFAIVTFAFGELIVLYVNTSAGLTGGSEGLTVVWGLGSTMPFGLSIYRYFSFWALGSAMLVWIVTVLVRRSHFGQKLVAVRDDEAAARSLGYSPVRLKTSIFVLASVLAAVPGVIVGPMSGFLSPDLMNVEQSIYILGLLLIGGVGRISGAVLGVALLHTLPHAASLDPLVRPVVIGLGMVTLILVQPSGIAGLLSSTWHRFHASRGASARSVRSSRAPA